MRLNKNDWRSSHIDAIAMTDDTVQQPVLFHHVVQIRFGDRKFKRLFLNEFKA
jgi:hypothetical protein